MAARPRARAPRATLIATALLTALIALALAPRAEAFVYWANIDAGTIGRANLDGTGVDKSFITGVSAPVGVAVDAAHVYWPDMLISGVPGDEPSASGTATIGRANLDGTGVDYGFIATADVPSAVTVDDAHVYWTDTATGIGRANLDGTGVDHSFIAAFGTGMAVDAAHIYWTDYFDGIGRANLDGTGVDYGFIALATPGPVELAVDGAHVYWANFETDTIGRANLDGTGVDLRYITGVRAPVGVAVDAAHVYWTSQYIGTIGRASLDGTGVDRRFITGLGDLTTGVAVDDLPFTFGKAKRNRKRGTAKLTVNVPDPGQLKLAKTKEVKGTKKRAEAEGSVKLPVKPRGKATKKLNRTGKAKVKAKVTYTPDGGEPNTKSKKLKLKKR